MVFYVHLYRGPMSGGGGGGFAKVGGQWWWLWYWWRQGLGRRWWWWRWWGRLAMVVAMVEMVGKGSSIAIHLRSHCISVLAMGTRTAHEALFFVLIILLLTTLDARCVLELQRWWYMQRLHGPPLRDNGRGWDQCDYWQPAKKRGRNNSGIGAGNPRVQDPHHCLLNEILLIPAGVLRSW